MPPLPGDVKREVDIAAVASASIYDKCFFRVHNKQKHGGLGTEVNSPAKRSKTPETITSMTTSPRSPTRTISLAAVDGDAG